MTLAIACSGGGNWCIPQLGFVHALHERGYETRAASGVSFGSLGSYAAVTGDPLGIFEKVKQFGERVDTNLLKVWEHRRSPAQLVERLERALHELLPPRVEVEGDYFVVALKVPTMKSIAFSRGDSLPAILRAAMAMPPLPPARYAGHVLRDAGLRLKYGIKPLVQAGYQKILALGSFSDGFPVRWATWQRMFPMFRPVHTHEVVMSVVRKIGVAEFTRAGAGAMEYAFEEGYRVGRRMSAHLLDSLVNEGRSQAERYELPSGFRAPLQLVA